ncbi:MAG: pilus assembly protein [Colwellia sp.]
MKKLTLISLLLFTPFASFSEDIELYISDSLKQAKERPQVLIVFDTSGSMSNNETVKASYNPDTNYDALTGYTKAPTNYIYYTKGRVDITDIPVADDTTEKRKFPLDISNCKVAQDIIAKYGVYTGHVREYQFQGNSGRWTELNNTDGSGIYLTDCEDDVITENNHNKNYLNGGTVTSLSNGYPIDGEGSSASPDFYTANAADSNVEWAGALVTLYSANYLRWYHNPDIPTVSKDRIDIAKESVTNLINSSPSVDFGLQVFNNGTTPKDGGRIVSALKESTLTNRLALVNLVNDDLTASGWTPLCESLYEASRYFGGENVYYGDNDSNSSPSRDTSAEVGGKYKSPFNSCSDKAYVILITDGVPKRDTHADDRVKALGVADNYPMSAFDVKNEDDDSYLPAIAGWMNHNDVNDNVDGKQTVSTYTIGFSDGADDAAPLLVEAAKLGGGKYFKATDTASLTAALTNVLANLDPSNDSLTSASVAANNFDRTETLDSVYYAMFQPDRGPRWQGNLKKYKVVGGQQVGKHGKAAINQATGHFSNEATSFWSSNVDGDEVAKGGVADMLRKASDRTLYSDIKGNTGTALTELTFDELISESNFYGSQAELASVLGVNEDDAQEHINWAQGMDVDDEDEDNDKTDMRYDVFGDPLHSKPLLVNYGDKIHIIVGTNAGALHMFKDNGDTVTESWAFMPKEFFPNIKGLRENYTGTAKIYGVDGKITSHINDINGDGIVNGSDTVWIFFGLRRGGSSYYALDITDPQNPSLMWKITDKTTNFNLLGQTWSQPKIAYSELNISAGVANPVLIFGGGYDISKDNDGVGTNDNVGNAIYMVDAKTGVLKWSLAPSGGTTTFTGTDGIPSSIGLLDSDGDGLTDRLYTGDTGGNVWRVDMPSANPTGTEPWTVHQLARLGSSVDNANDRRFFNEPSIVRTFITETMEETTVDANGDEVTIVVTQEKPYDAILIGTGDRTNPLGTDTDDSFFMLKDKHIKTQVFSAGHTAPPSVITIADLYDYTNDPFGNVSDAGRQALSIAVSKKSGWYLNLTQDGEKNTANAIVINNVVYFTSFTPPNSSIEVEGCQPPNGQGWLYSVDLALGIKRYNHHVDPSDASRDGDKRIEFISEQFLGAPTLIVIPEDDNDDDTVDQSVGNLIVGRKIIPVSFRVQTMRNYLYIDEER